MLLFMVKGRCYNLPDAPVAYRCLTGEHYEPHGGLKFVLAMPFHADISELTQQDGRRKNMANLV